MNEPCHMVAGLAHWKYGRFDLYNVNPPLIRMVATLPILVIGTETDWSQWNTPPPIRSEFLVGPDWVAANREAAIWQVMLARFACIPFSVAGALVCFLWSRDLYGNIPGLLACSLWCFSPAILGNASCITPDAHAAAIGVAASYAFWCWLQRPTWSIAMITGVLLGLTLLSKITWILLLPLWPLMWVFWQMTDSYLCLEMLLSRSFLRNAVQFSLIVGIGVNVLNCGYGYDGTFHLLGEFKFFSSTLSGKADGHGNRFQGTPLALCPIPLPDQFVYGADIQKHDHEKRPTAYLRGQTFNHGAWYFYIYALLVKMPSGVIALMIMTVGLKLLFAFQWYRLRDEFVLLAPSIIIIAAASSDRDYTAHMRYILPSVPFAFIWISQIAGTAFKFQSENGKPLSIGNSYTSRLISDHWCAVRQGVVVLTKCLATICVLSIVGSTLWHAPHWLSYFNEFAGGPANGYRHLANSNCDWGQDLLYFKQWQVDHPELSDVGLAYYGMFHPHDIGVEFIDVPVQIASNDELNLHGGCFDKPTGWYAVSANFVTGHTSWGYRANGSRVYYQRPYFGWFSRLTPVDRAGYSILIYHVTDEDLKRLDEEGVRIISPQCNAFKEQIEWEWKSP
ncbi:MULTISPECIES: glycosyltransferase family 39 protein [Pirellulaceae]|nr:MULTISPECIES: glycosyltransferase family 39 protein [Pirellulaceae]